jgi:hypothetical protein
LFGLTDATFAMRGFSSSRGIRAKKQSSTPQPGLEANFEVVMALGAGSLTGFRWWVALQAEFCFYQSNDYGKDYGGMGTHRQPQSGSAAKLLDCHQERRQ